MNQNQTTERSYTQVGSSSSNNPRWEPTKNAHNPQYPTTLEGYFVKLREITGANGTFKVAEIQTVDVNGTLSTLVDVSGGKVLDDKLSTIPLGAFIMIKFGGKQPSKTPGRTYNVWETYIDENAIPYHQLGGVAQVAAPAVQQQVANPFGNAPAQQVQQPFMQQAPATPFTQQAPAQGIVPPAAPFGGANPFNQGNSDLPF